MMKNALHNYLTAFLACIAMPATICCAAEEDTQPDATKMFKTSPRFSLSYLDDTDLDSRDYFPQETTKEHNYLGYCSSVCTTDNYDIYHDDCLTVYAYCACKRKDNVYDYYYVVMPASRDSHVFHALLKLDRHTVTFKAKYNGGPSEIKYETEATDEIGIKDSLADIAERKGRHAADTMKRLRDISAAHAQGGNKKVREILNGKLSDDIADYCAEDREEAKEAKGGNSDEAVPLPAPGSTPKTVVAPLKDLPITVRNNMPEKIRVGKRLATIVEQNDSSTTVSWLLEITNTSSDTLDFFSITHHILNAAELKIDDSMENVKKLKPGETRKVRSRVMVENDVWAKAAAHEFTIES